MIAEPYSIYFTLAIIFLAFAAIIKDYLRAEVALLFAVLVFHFSGVLSTQELIAGLSNTSIISVLLITIITAGLRNHFNLEKYFTRLFDGGSSIHIFLLKMCSQVALLSSIVNNTPVVALLTPYVYNWGKKKGFSPSKLLIPLSFATIMGGMITIIGTSTTLVLNGFMEEYREAPFHFTSFLIIGLTVTVVGVLFLAFVAPSLLPDHSNPSDEFNRRIREYLIETKLNADAGIVGKTIQEAGLRNLQGAFLAEILRDQKSIYPVGPQEILQSNDTLIFVGNTERIIELVEQNQDISFPKNVLSAAEQTHIAEAVISFNSSLIGKRIKDTDFRNRYDAAIVAVHRNGEKLKGKIGELKLMAGDLLLLFAGSEFQERVDIYKDLIMISAEAKEEKASRPIQWFFWIFLVANLTLLILGYFQLFTFLACQFAFMIGTKMINLRLIKRELDLNLAAILVLSLAISTAIIKTGTGAWLADGMISFLMPYGQAVLIIGLLLITTLLTSFISNVGAVSVAFPIAYAITQQMGVDGTVFYLAIAYAASAAFLTPIGYQTNLIIYGPGSYTFKDFFKVGLPVTLLYLSIVFIMLMTIFP